MIYFRATISFTLGWLLGFLIFPGGANTADLVSCLLCLNFGIYGGRNFLDD